jgi:HEAT repeat protein
VPRDILLDLMTDLEHLLAAGAAAATADERLARHGRQLRGLAERVPALAPLAEAIALATRTTARQADRRAAVMLDLNLLLRRARAGLATVGQDGALEAVDPSGPWTTNLRLDEPVFTNLLPELADPAARPLNALILADHAEMGTELRLVGPLLAGLEHPDKDAPHRIAYGFLPHFGKAIVPELRRDFDPQGARGDAMRLLALSRIDAAACLSACRTALAAGSDLVRSQALELLVELDAAEAESAALRVLREPSAAKEVRCAALKALGGARSDAALEVLLATADGDDKEAWAAWRAFRDCPHPAATIRLLDKVQTLAAEVAGAEAGRGREQLARRVQNLMNVLIDRQDPSGMREFLGWLDHPVKELRDWARRRLGNLYERGRPVIPELTALLRHKDAIVLVAAIDSLTRCEADISTAVPRLIELLRNKRPGVRQQAARLLGRTASPPKEVVAALAALLHDSSPNVRRQAAESLGRCGPPAQTAVAALVEALNDPQFDVCSAALRALGQIGPPAAAALPAILALQQHRYASIRHQSLGVIALLGEPGVTRVVELLRDPVRGGEMMSALSRYAGVDAAIVRELVGILRDSAHPRRATAASLLGGLRDAARPGLEALIEALNENNDTLREAAADALSTLAIQAKVILIPLAATAVPALAQALKDGPYRVRVDACRVLEQFGADARPAVSVLTAATNDPDFIVRAGAREALRVMAEATGTDSTLPSTGRGHREAKRATE